MTIREYDNFRIINCVNPYQTGPLIWVYHVCPHLFVRNHSSFDIQLGLNELSSEGYIGFRLFWKYAEIGYFG